MDDLKNIKYGTAKGRHINISGFVSERTTKKKLYYGQNKKKYQNLVKTNN